MKTNYIADLTTAKALTIAQLRWETYPWYKKLWLRLMGAESCNKK